MLPLPKTEKPKIGTNIPMISSPKPFRVSETATAFRPPKIAYKAPTEPIITIVKTSAWL